MEKEEVAGLKAADLAVYQELTLWELLDHTASEQESLGKECSWLTGCSKTEHGLKV